jgi:hypothetical protein
MQHKELSLRASTINKVIPEMSYEACVKLQDAPIPIKASEFAVLANKHNLSTLDVLNHIIEDKETHDPEDILNNDRIIFYAPSAFDLLASMLEDNA